MSNRITLLDKLNAHALLIPPASNNLKQIDKDDIRLCFAPFTGAIVGVKKEYKRRKDASII